MLPMILVALGLLKKAMFSVLVILLVLAILAALSQAVERIQQRFQLAKKTDPEEDGRGNVVDL